jgi:hypothetical protein
MSSCSVKEDIVYDVCSLLDEYWQKQLCFGFYVCNSNISKPSLYSCLLILLSYLFNIWLFLFPVTNSQVELFRIILVCILIFSCSLHIHYTRVIILTNYILSKVEFFYFPNIISLSIFIHVNFMCTTFTYSKF